MVSECPLSVRLSKENRQYRQPMQSFSTVVDNHLSFFSIFTWVDRELADNLHLGKIELNSLGKRPERKPLPSDSLTK
jgi:hypothetical protein